MLFRTLFFVLLFSLASNVSSSYAQTITLGDSIRIKIKKIKVKRATGVQINDSKRRIKKSKQKELYVYCLIESLNGKKVKIDAFSLVDKTNKLRFRTSSFMGSKGKSWVGTNFQSERYLKTEILNSKGKTYSAIPKYDPTKKDHFYDFNLEGYTNIETFLYFGRNNQQGFTDMFKKTKHLRSVVYYSDAKYDTFLGRFYFPYEVDERIEYHLYYGKKSVTKIEP
jgi:hypothetical protein